MHHGLATAAVRHDGGARDEACTAAPPLSRGKDQGIETLRGLAIALVVVGHVVNSLEIAGLLASGSMLFQCHLALLHVRMPLFTAISGYVYALRPVVAGGRRQFLTGKLRRLMMPLLTISTLQYLVRSQVAAATNPAELSEIWRIYVYRGDIQFWFLQSLLLVFALTAWIDGGQRMPSCRSWCFWVGGAAIAMLFGPTYELFSLNGFLYLLPFFLFGCGVERFQTELSKSSHALLAGGVLAVAMAVQQAGLWGYAEVNLDRRSVLGLAIGLSSTFLLIRFRVAIRPLAWLGKHAYAIFLFHILAASGCRVLLRMAGVENVGALLIVCSVVGLGAPILVERVAGGWPWARFLLRGQRWREKPKTLQAPAKAPAVAPM